MELFKSAVASFEAEYKDLADVWKQLEVKGQGLAVIDGVLLTGSITFATRVQNEFLAENRWLLVGLLIAIFGSIAVAIRVLRTQELGSAPYGQTYYALIEPLCDLSQEELTPRQANIYRDQIKLWRAATTGMRVQIRKKGDWLLYGQVSMFVALVFLLVLFARIIFHSPTP